MYSSLSNKRTGPNKRTGWNFDKNQISVQGGILIKILECRVKNGNFIHNKGENLENLPSFSQKISRLGLNI